MPNGALKFESPVAKKPPRTALDPTPVLLVIVMRHTVPGVIAAVLEPRLVW